jgi:hypothetical protein
MSLENSKLVWNIICPMWMIVEQMGCWLDVEINGIGCLEFIHGHMVNS